MSKRINLADRKSLNKYLANDDNFKNELDQVLENRIPDEEEFLSLLESFFTEEGGETLDRTQFLWFYKEASKVSK